MKKLLLLSAFLIGCAGYEAQKSSVTSTDVKPWSDPYIVVDRAEMYITGDVTGLYVHNKKPMRAVAYAGGAAPSATITAITYNNPASTVGFTLSTGSLVAGSFTGDILSFGTFAIIGLNDNKLKVCPAAGEANNGSTKCNKAKIRVYSATGDVDGIFNNTTDGYYIPLLVGGTAVGVGVANAAYVQTVVIASNKNRLRATDFTSATASFPVTMDFTNGGAGSYAGTIVVEYVLIKE